MMDKRLLKLKYLKEELPQPLVIGQGENVIVTWGSSRLPVEEILPELENTRMVVIRGIYPFKDNLKEILKSNKIICVEQNAQGQLSFIIEKWTGKEVIKVLKYNGRPFYPEEIIEKIRKIL